MRKFLQRLKPLVSFSRKIMKKKKFKIFVCYYPGGCGNRSNGRCELMTPCGKYIKKKKRQIGQHWMEIALERIYAGEKEKKVLYDYGYSLVNYHAHEGRGFLGREN